MSLGLIEGIFVIFFILSFIIGSYLAYKCIKDMEKYKVKIYPDQFAESTDNFPA